MAQCCHKFDNEGKLAARFFTTASKCPEGWEGDTSTAENCPPYPQGGTMAVSSQERSQVLSDVRETLAYAQGQLRVLDKFEAGQSISYAKLMHIAESSELE